MRVSAGCITSRNVPVALIDVRCICKSRQRPACLSPTDKTFLVTED